MGGKPPLCDDCHSSCSGSKYEGDASFHSTTTSFNNILEEQLMVDLNGQCTINNLKHHGFVHSLLNTADTFEEMGSKIHSFIEWQLAKGSLHANKVAESS
jgi:hypothetical protein